MRFRGITPELNVLPSEQERLDELDRRISEQYKIADKADQENRMDDAAAARLAIVELVRRKDGEYSYHHSSILYNVGKDAYNRSDYATAERLWLEAERIKELVGGEHDIAHGTWEMLALLYTQTGEFAKKVDYARKTVKWRAKFVGKDHMGYVTALRSYAFALREAKRFAEAETVYQEAIRVCRTSAAKDSEYFLASSLAGLCELWHGARRLRQGLAVRQGGDRNRKERSRTVFLRDNTYRNGMVER